MHGQANVPLSGLLAYTCISALTSWPFALAMDTYNVSDSVSLPRGLSKQGECQTHAPLIEATPHHVRAVDID